MKAWERKFRQVLSEMEHGERPKSLSAPAISALVGAPSPFDLSSQAAELAKEGRLRIEYRLLSPVTKTEIGRFRHFSEIPGTAYDESADQSIKVVPSRDVEIVYQVVAGS